MKTHEMSSRYSKDYLLRLFPYSLGEDIANAVSHCVGAFISIGLLISLTWIAGRYGNWVDGVAYIFFGLSMVLTFVMSTIYHSMIHHVARDVLKRMDHISIFVLIVGTYTPYVFSLLRTTLAYQVYAGLILLMILGIIFKALHAGKFKRISTLIYILMGWISLILLPQIIVKLSYWGVFFLVTGGIIYTVGAIFYAFSRFKYSHMVWHIFVICAVISMYISVGFFILQERLPV